MKFIFKYITTFIFILVVFPLSFSAKEMRIGILRNVKMKQVAFKVDSGSYSINSSVTLNFKKGQSIKIYQQNKQIRVKYPDHSIATFDTLYITPNSEDAIFSIKGLLPGFSERKYYAKLKVFVQNGLLTLVNEINLEKYIIGVLESEVGLNRTKDFYKVQAVISRTYALKNQYKFLHEGFHLTDLVNCQVYKGRMYKDKTIEKAVKETKDLVLVDENMEYITAAYFSNSGGQTNNVEDVWLKALPYLRSIHDPYSVDCNNYTWVKTINKAKWLNYLKTKYKFPIDNSEAVNAACNFKQEIRHKYLVDWVYQIPLKEIRTDWKFKSTYFSITEKDNILTFNGKGFGHGVGLSQEGAMKMIDLGYDFLDVLRFYYTDVHLINLSMRDFYLID
jgi:stage II sporulation protein D